MPVLFKCLEVLFEGLKHAFLFALNPFIYFKEVFYWVVMKTLLRRTVIRFDVYCLLCCGEPSTLFPFRRHFIETQHQVRDVPSTF